MHIDLSGKTVLVTGASRGIGKALAKSLGRAGAEVAIHYGNSREPAVELAESLPAAHIFQADLAQPTACKQLVEAVVAHFGKIDVLVNNAGIAFSSDPAGTDEQWLSEWDLTQHVNLRAAAYLCKLLLPHYQTQGGGRFIHIASRAAFRGDTPEYLAYAASKAGMVALSRSLARAYGKQGITSFVVAPGFIRTDMAQQFIDEYGEQLVLDDLSLDRLTEPEDLAPTVTLLASGLMDHATGCTIDINAGSYVR
ncbi:MAG: SDR family oxidoreductase [Bacteroidota bacterium]